jgi:pectate lyase
MSEKKKKSKYSGPCLATNPIDRCWRCRKDWATDRQRLARCAKGFGREATGGLGGKIYIVTDPSDEDFSNPRPGTLRWGVVQTEPLWIIFANDMIITPTQEIVIQSDKTIDGRGAQVHIANGGGLTIQNQHNIIIHNLHIHDIKHTDGGNVAVSPNHFTPRTRADGDGVSIFNGSNVWIDHISMSLCEDGMVDVVAASTAITISNCHLTNHNDVMLFGANDNQPEDKVMQVTVAFNHFGRGLVQRMPRCRYGFFHVVNNDYTHWLMYAIGGSSNPTIISQGNRYIAPPNMAAKQARLSFLLFLTQLDD